MDFVSILEKQSTLVNPRTTINIYADKYRTSLRLADYGLTQPKTKLINISNNQTYKYKKQILNFSNYETLRGSKRCWCIIC